ncbi:2,3-dihydro-3-hydroxyanthranilate isomerase [Pseudomonas aeruginosa VRFPA06]|nr:PhzF family phenazine biosynthesis isomerase [Pseudomonas aeruginosa]ETD80459.1 2,3-dihydro-3-hydroxyanthranilate isomerase [Pseudomonas aeruginosa VRFPA06]
MSVDLHALIPLIALTFLLAGFVKGVVGLGLPTVSVGLLGLAMPPMQAAALLIVPSMVTNLWQLACGPRFLGLMKRLAGLLLGVIVGTLLVGAWLGGDAPRQATGVLGLALAAYPLLGTAIALGAETDKDRLFLETRMGTVPFALERQDGKVVACSMQQPIPTWEHFSRPAELLAALGLKGSTFPIEVYRNGPRHVFVGLESVAALSALHPDHRALCDFPDLAVNCFAGAGRHWRSRMFSPAYGVVEDAATGSAAGPLAIHLARHRQIPYGQQIEILQGVEIGRPSRMYARAEGAGERVSAVEVSGNGAAFAEGRAYL